MRDFWRGLKLLIVSSFKSSPRIALFGLGLEPAGYIVSAFTALFIKWIVDGATGGDLSVIRSGAIGIAAVTLGGGIMRFIGWPLRTKLLEETGAWLDARILRLQGAMPGLEHTERSEYFDRLQSIQGSGFASAIMFVVGAAASFGRIFVGIGLLASIHPVLALLPAFGVPSVLIGTRVARIEDASWVASRSLWHRANAFYSLHISPGPAKELRIFGLEDEVRRVHDRSRAEASAQLTRTGIRTAALQAAGWSFFALGYIGTLGLVAFRVSSGTSSIGELMLAITVAAQMNESVSSFAGSIQGLAGRLMSAKHFLWLEDEAQTARVEATSDAPGELRDGIRFDHVSFTYPGTERPVLEDVNLVLPAGSRVAIVGDNGAGKTTIVKLLGGFYRPTSGTITVDGVDLTTIDPEDWRRRLSAGFQDYCRFELRAARTVGIGDLPRIDERPAIETALGRAGATEVQGVLVDGLDTQLGKSFDNGVDLSMGQWQKLALGRAFMRDAPLLLVLDEPTSSLDAPTEHALFSRYAAVAEERAGAGGITILVSHRFSTVRTADLIVVVDGGRVREIGTHADLMADDGLYAELFTLQAAGYR